MGRYSLAKDGSFEDHWTKTCELERLLAPLCKKLDFQIETTDQNPHVQICWQLKERQRDTWLFRKFNTNGFSGLYVAKMYSSYERAKNYCTKEEKFISCCP